MSVVIIPEQDGDVHGALAAQTALQVVNQYAGANLTRTFLMKKARVTYAIKALTNDENIVIGMARGTATVTQIKDALEEDIDPESSDYLEKQGSVRMVIWESIRQVMQNAEGNGGPVCDSYEFQLGGGRGIPFQENEGWQWFVYNPTTGSALTTGSSSRFQNVYYGAWLK